MRTRFKVRFIVAAAALLVAASSACTDPNAFQPIATGAQPWQPPCDFQPDSQCTVGYYIAIDSCPGCTGISYALCNGDAFDQCVCGGPYTPGATCPNQISCSDDDFPPQGWLEFTDYTGACWAGNQFMDAGTGSSADAAASD
jgi:hypothetical protein